MVLTPGLKLQRAGSPLALKTIRLLSFTPTAPGESSSLLPSPGLHDGTELLQEICVAQEAQTTVVSWRLLNKCERVRLFVRPFLSGRDYHSLHKENPAFRFEATCDAEKILRQPYEGLPGIYGMYSNNGSY